MLTKLTVSTHYENKVNIAKQKTPSSDQEIITVCVDNETVKTLYTSLVKPHLEHGNVWYSGRIVSCW